jgi:putative acetyltransferase
VAAFETAAEADLVDALRQQADPVVSLVAEEADAILGHIMFSPVTLANAAPGLRVMALAPMAVAGAYRRRGTGSALVTDGLRRCRQLGAGAIVVLGHPTYYPRFGFRPASHFQLTCEYSVPDDVFMALELSPGSLQNSSGVIRYHPAFANL